MFSQTDSDNFEVDSVYLIIFYKKKHQQQPEEFTVSPSECVGRYLTKKNWIHNILNILTARDETVTLILLTFVSPQKNVFRLSSDSHYGTEIITEYSIMY